ncbi:MAG: dephospho-CoA kinase [Bacteroidetes bacterium]|nr:dephospho-CoA kinase [Bacteroidota bacterium]
MIGVTGGIGSGKSTVCDLFEQRKVPVFRADAVARTITEGPAKKEIVVAFGPEILDESGSLDRKALAAIVFSDEEKLELLNSVVHPLVFDEFSRWKAALPAGTRYALAEAALMFESGMFQMMDYVLAVMADENVRVSRTMARDAADEAAVRSRLRFQLSAEELIELSDFQLSNNGSLGDLGGKVSFFAVLFSTLTPPPPENA